MPPKRWYILAILKSNIISIKKQRFDTSVSVNRKKSVDIISLQKCKHIGERCFGRKKHVSIGKVPSV